MDGKMKNLRKSSFFTYIDHRIVLAKAIFEKYARLLILPYFTNKWQNEKSQKT